MTINRRKLLDSKPVSASLCGNTFDLRRHENAEKRVKFPTWRCKTSQPPYCNTGVSEIKHPTIPTLRAAFRDRPAYPASCSEPDFDSKTARATDFLPAKPAFYGGQTTSVAEVCKMPFDELHSNKRRTASLPNACRVTLLIRHAVVRGVTVRSGGSGCATWAMLVPIGGQYDFAIHYAQYLIRRCSQEIILRASQSAYLG